MQSWLLLEVTLRYRLAGTVLRRFARIDAVLGILALSLTSSVSVYAQQGNERTFSSPGEAVLALYNAVKSNDSQALAAIFGSDANKVLHTGDNVADKNMAANFLRAYDQMHRVVIEP
ncbi:MAG TPA: DUF2950 family protein, partial [Terriglobales bacterium]|nr:DUF2950 family protein [Terriglobales bacterium]